MPVIDDHPAIPRAPDDCTLWRFMSVTKFVSLLTTKNLVFPQIALLADRDPKEGRYTAADEELAKEMEADPKFYKEILVPNEISLSSLKARTNYIKKTYYVSCWNMSDHEPAQLWSSYASEKDGIAIKSSVTELKNALGSGSEDVFIGKIEYQIDDEAYTPMVNLFYHVYRKRIEFYHEKELRLSVVRELIPSSFNNNPKSYKKAFSSLPRVIPIPVKPNEYIDEIRVAPFAGEWVVDAITRLAADFNLSAPVRRSVLAG